MATICGIDEAGRGPVIGPLVITGVLIDEKDEKKLLSIGVKDSKKLSALQRERMFDGITEAAKDIKTIITSPKEIDEAVESEHMNLNWLEAEHMITILNELKPDKAVIDCPSNNIIAFKNYLKVKLKKKIELRLAHKADELYPVVSAASIIPKVTRDKEIVKIKERIGEEFGSGYPSDPATKRFIEKNYTKYPDIFRKSWETYRALADGKKQKKLGEY